MKIRLTEDKLHQLIYECVQKVLNEGKQGIQSQKLYDIVQQHGGLVDTHALDVHNLSDEDIVTVMTKQQLRDITDDRRYIRDHGRWADNYALDVWAKENNVDLIPGDRMEYMELGDGNVVIIINRNECQVQSREGEGWDAYHKKREERRKNAFRDGKNSYIPKYREHFSDGRMRNNPWKKEFSREQIDKEMQDIRDYYAKGDERGTNY